jgi:hypothetical protein
LTKIKSLRQARLKSLRPSRRKPRNHRLTDEPLTAGASQISTPQFGLVDALRRTRFSRSPCRRHCLAGTCHPSVRRDAVGLAKPSASFNFVAQSPQHTSTVLPRSLTRTGLSSSSPSQAAQVLLAMTSHLHEHPKMFGENHGAIGAAIRFFSDLAVQRGLPESGG